MIDPVPPLSSARRWLALPIVLAVSLLTFIPDGGVSGGLRAASYLGAAVLAAIPALRLGPRARIGGMMMMLSAFFVIGLAATLATNQGWAPAGRWLLMSTSLTLIGFAVSHLTPLERNSMYRGIISLACIQLGIAGSQKYFGGPVLWGYLGSGGSSVHGVNVLWGTPPGRAMGSLAHPIPLAFLLGYGAVLAALSPAIRHRFVGWALAGALTWGVLLTGTRSAVIALLLVVVFLSLTRGLRTHALALKALSVGFLSVAALALFDVADVGRMPLFATLDGTLSLTHRLGAAQVAANLLSEPILNVLFGHGRGAFGELAQTGVLQSTWFVVVDNTLVSTMVVCGLVGLALLLALLVRAFVAGDATTRACLIFVAVMFFSFDVVLWAPSFSLFLIVLMGSEKMGSGRRYG